MTARDRRALTAGAALVLAAILVVRILPAALRHYQATRAATAARLATLARAREAVRSAQLVRDSFALAAQQLVALAPKLVPGSTAAEAAANLTSELSAAADRAGLHVVAFDALPDNAAGTFVPIALRGELEGDVAALAAFLQAVEAGPLVLAVRSLAILAADPLERQPGPERLRIEMVVAGWRLRSEP